MHLNGIVKIEKKNLDDIFAPWPMVITVEQTMFNPNTFWDWFRSYSINYNQLISGTSCSPMGVNLNSGAGIVLIVFSGYATVVSLKMFSV